MREKNLLIGAGLLAALNIPVGAALFMLSYELGAGTVSYNTGMGFVLTESIICIINFVRWYHRVSVEAADLTFATEKRKAAHRNVWPVFVVNFLITGIIAAVGFIATILSILFVDVSSAFSYTAVASMFVAGNVLLTILMFFCVPYSVNN